MPRQTRPGSTLEGRLEAFVVKQLGELDFSQVTCPRRDCGQIHTVHEATWREGMGVAQGSRTRSCPYCFKVSRIP